MQTAVNSASYVTSTSLQFQVNVNRENFKVLEKYIREYNRWYSFMTERRGSDIADDNEIIREVSRKCIDLRANLDQLRDSVDTMEKETEKKHVSILNICLPSLEVHVAQ